MRTLSRLPILLVTLLSLGAVGSLRDSRGREVRVTPAPMRIISGALASDEVVHELLRRTKTLDRLVAVSTLADDPRYSSLAPLPSTLKGRFGGELESALALKPDLVILASYNKPETLKRLEQAGVETFVVGDFTTLVDVERNIRVLGELIGEPATGDALASEFNAACARLTKSRPTGSASPPTVLQYFPDGSMSGKNTLFDELARAAGADNLAAKRGLVGWPRVGVETIVSMRPDVVVASGEASERAAILTSLQSKPGWKDLPAVREGRIAVIPERLLGSVSQHLPAAIEALQSALREYQKK